MVIDLVWWHDVHATSEPRKVDVVPFGLNERIGRADFHSHLHFDQLQAEGRLDVIDVAGGELTQRVAPDNTGEGFQDPHTQRDSDDTRIRYSAKLDSSLSL